LNHFKDEECPRHRVRRLKRRRRGISVENNTKNVFKLRQERHLRHVANTYAQIYIHVVFAVEGRQSLIQPEHNDELQKYIAGILFAHRQKLIAINNMPDHLHLLVGLRPDSSSGAGCFVCGWSYKYVAPTALGGGVNVGLCNHCLLDGFDDSPDFVCRELLTFR
jgi:hypothetical protein